MRINKYPSDDEIYSGMKNSKTKATKKLLASESGSYPLPSVQNSHYSYEDIINKNNKQIINRNKSKETINRTGTYLFEFFYLIIYVLHVCF